MKLKNKNYHKIKLEFFFITLFQENLKNISKFLVDFFIRYENNLQNYLEIFSKDFKKLLKRLNEEDNKIIDNKNLNSEKKENNDIKIKDKYITDRETLISNFKRFFDLNFRKSFFITDDKNQIIRAKIFTKILKTIIRCKGITLNYKLLIPESFNTNKEITNNINNDISNEIEYLNLNKPEKSIFNLFIYDFWKKLNN